MEVRKLVGAKLKEASLFLMFSFHSRNTADEYALENIVFRKLLLTQTLSLSCRFFFFCEIAIKKKKIG